MYISTMRRDEHTKGNKMRLIHNNLMLVVPEIQHLSNGNLWTLSPSSSRFWYVIRAMLHILKTLECQYQHPLIG